MQCYDCGCLIEPGKAKRRRVKIGDSRGVLGADWRHYYGDVVLCLDCARSRDIGRAIGLVIFAIVGLLAYAWLV